MGKKEGRGRISELSEGSFPLNVQPCNVLLKLVVGYQLKRGAGNIEEKRENYDRGPGEWVRADGLPFISDSPPCIVSSDTLPKS